MAKLEAGGWNFEFEMPKAGVVLEGMLECKGLIRAAGTRQMHADELIDDHKIADATPILAVVEELEYELGNRLQKLLFSVVPELADGFPETMTELDAKTLLQQFAATLLFGGDRVKN